MIEKDFQKYLEKARYAAEHAYAPYSKFFVGACIVYEDGSEYTGCNVENASYGLSLCAERNAISNAIGVGQKGKLEIVAISCKNTKNCSPCGACRQWIYEFNEEAKVVLEDENNQPVVYKISELLPKGFKL